MSASTAAPGSEAAGPTIGSSTYRSSARARSVTGVHLDVWVPHDQAEARVAAAIAAGGHLVTDQWAPSWWVLADPEGNEACVATWIGTDGHGYP